MIEDYSSTREQYVRPGKLNILEDLNFIFIYFSLIQGQGFIIVYSVIARETFDVLVEIFV